jgi:hypothetical protein
VPKASIFFDQAKDLASSGVMRDPNTKARWEAIEKSMAYYIQKLLGKWSAGFVTRAAFAFAILASHFFDI